MSWIIYDLINSQYEVTASSRVPSHPVPSIVSISSDHQLEDDITLKSPVTNNISSFMLFKYSRSCSKFNKKSILIITRLKVDELNICEEYPYEFFLLVNFLSNRWKLFLIYVIGVFISD